MTIKHKYGKQMLACSVPSLLIWLVSFSLKCHMQFEFHCNYSYFDPNNKKKFISYLGVKSWDLQVCDRASTITHVDREKKNSAYYNNKMFYFFLG